MNFWDMFNQQGAVIVAGLVALTSGVATIVSAIATIVQARKNAEILLSQVQPEIKTHKCKVCDEDVYTYFDEDDVSHPACPYLAPDGSVHCTYNVSWRTDPKEGAKARDIRKAHEDRCYLAMWGQKVSGGDARPNERIDDDKPTSG